MSPTKPLAALRLLALFALYTCVTIWLTWPLGADPSRTLPCTDPACKFDTRYSAWVLAWQSHALSSDTARVADANIYHPAPDALYYGPAGFGALPYFAPTFLASGSAALATNVMLLLSVTLSALSLHWVVHRWTGLQSAGFVAAATLLLNRWYLWGFVGATPHLAPLQYFPLIAWLAAADPLGWRQAAILVVLVVAQCLTDPVYVAAAVFAPVGTLAVTRLFRARSRRSGLVLVGVLIASLLCLLPFFQGYLRVRARNPRLAEQTLWYVGARLTDLSSLLWRGSMPTTIAPAALVLLLLGGVLVLRRRGRASLPHDPGWRQGLLWLLVGVAISLSPVARCAGYRVYLPQYLLAVTTPLYEIIRVPTRLGVAAMIGGCILCGIAFAEVVAALETTRAARATGRALRGVLAACVVAALYWISPVGSKPLPASYPGQKLPVPPASFLAELRGGSGPLLQLPTLSTKLRSWPSPNWNAQAMYLSTFHWRPLLNGYSSYWPDGFRERMDLAEKLPSRAALLRLVQETGLRAIWVDLGDYKIEQRKRWRDAAFGLVRGLELRQRERNQLLFAIDPAVIGGARPDTAR